MNSRLTHTEIIQEGKLRLPITNTGYYLHFMDVKHLSEYKDISSFVIACLDDAAQSKEWQAYLSDQKQLTLF